MLAQINLIFNKRQKRNLGLLFIVIFIGSLMELMGVSLIMPLVTVIMNPNILETNRWVKVICGYFHITDQTTLVLALLVVLIFIYIGKNIYLIMMYGLQYRFTYNNQRRLALRLMSCYMRQKYIFHVSQNSAELQRNVTTDVEQFFLTISNCIQVLSEATTCLLLIIYLLTTDILTTLGVACVIGFFVLLFYFWFRRSLVKLGGQLREESAKLIKWIHQSFEGIKEVKVMNRENYFLNHFDQTYHNLSSIQKKQNLLKATPKPILESICICGILMIMMLRIISGTDTAQFIPVLSVFAVSAFRMLPAFNRITNSMGAIMFTKPSVKAVYDDLKEIERLSEAEEADMAENGRIRLTEAISVRNIFFRYPGTEKYILNNIDLDIPANQSVAFIGPSGAGKTTLADVMLGLLQPERGIITVDGINVFEHLNSWHRSIGYIPQSIFLMDDTIGNNISFGMRKDEIDEEQIWQALREAQLEDFVRSLEKGLDTMVGERGVRLSGGQRQRIGIARALYHSPDILILDEATSALDNETEKAVMEAIENLQGQKTMIIIAHRLTTIAHCDQIYEINEGKIAQCDRNIILNRISMNI